MTQLETSRLILRPWCDSDAQALYRWARDPEVGPFAGWAPHTSVENSREIIRTVLSEEGTFAVLLKGGDGGPIGSVGVFPTAIPVGKGEPEIGYWIAHPYWGQGLVPEAVEELLRWQFQEMGVQRVWCAHSPENEKSRRVQEKCGFRFHHTEWDVHWAATDEIKTEHYSILTRAEWLARQKPED